MKRREFMLGHVSPLRNYRLALILFEASLIILWGNAAMAMTLKPHSVARTYESALAAIATCLHN